MLQEIPNLGDSSWIGCRFWGCILNLGLFCQQKKNLSCMDLVSLSMLLEILTNGLDFLGVGMNCSPRLSKDLRLAGGLMVVVKS